MRRGFSPKDKCDFTGPAIHTMKYAAEDLYSLMNRGYKYKGASIFVGNHYQLSERQRIALTRIVSSKNDIEARTVKQKQAEDIKGEAVNIDGFNEIITLEVALSSSPVLACMDGTYRDLAGLRGTYKLIEKTDLAIKMILSELKGLSVKRAVFWLDAPVSNSGRLKTRTNRIASESQIDIEVNLINNVDKVLYDLPNVISSDSVVLDRCSSWFNLKEKIMPGISGIWIIDLGLNF